MFNSLTNSDAYAADQLFATLDSTLRRIDLPNFGAAIVADTVGFISHLPHQLVEAFRATLEETASADLLLHVIDCAHESHEDYIEEVNDVLEEIGADSVFQLKVFNKIDLLDSKQRNDIKFEQTPELVGTPDSAWVSEEHARTA